MKAVNIQRGQLLIEAVLAMAVVGILITAVVVALNFSVNNSKISKDQNLATSYAQEGLDIARNMKESDFVSFSTLANGTYCLPAGSTAIIAGQACTPLIDAKFRREVFINQSGLDSSGGSRCTTGTGVFVASIVTWTDNRCTNNSNCHKTELNTCLVDPNKFIN